MKTIYETEIAGLPIKLERTRSGKEFTVTYWKQVRKGLNYEHAAEELGYCIMHAPTDDDRALLVKYGSIQALKDAGFYGSADRLERETPTLLQPQARQE